MTIKIQDIHFDVPTLVAAIRAYAGKTQLTDKEKVEAIAAHPSIDDMLKNMLQLYIKYYRETKKEDWIRQFQAVNVKIILQHLEETSYVNSATEAALTHGNKLNAIISDSIRKQHKASFLSTIHLDRNLVNDYLSLTSEQRKSLTLFIASSKLNAKRQLQLKPLEGLSKTAANITNPVLSSLLEKLPNNDYTWEAHPEVQHLIQLHAATGSLHTPNVKYKRKIYPHYFVENRGWRTTSRFGSISITSTDIILNIPSYVRSGKTWCTKISMNTLLSVGYTVDEILSYMNSLKKSNFTGDLKNEPFLVHPYMEYNAKHLLPRHIPKGSWLYHLQQQGFCLYTFEHKFLQASVQQDLLNNENIPITMHVGNLTYTFYRYLKYYINAQIQAYRDFRINTIKSNTRTKVKLKSPAQKSRPIEWFVTDSNPI